MKDEFTASKELISRIMEEFLDSHKKHTINWHKINKLRNMIIKIESETLK